MMIAIVFLLLVFIFIVVIAAERVTLAHLGVEVREAGQNGVHAHTSLHFVVVAAWGARLLAAERLLIGLIGSFQLSLVEKAPVFSKALEVVRGPILGLGVDLVGNLDDNRHVTVADGARARMVEFVFVGHWDQSFTYLAWGEALETEFGIRVI